MAHYQKYELHGQPGAHSGMGIVQHNTNTVIYFFHVCKWVNSPDPAI